MQQRAMTAEAASNLASIGIAEKAWFGEQGIYRAADPSPPGPLRLLASVATVEALASSFRSFRLELRGSGSPRGSRIARVRRPGGFRASP
jgi:hypothetical protein